MTTAFQHSYLRRILLVIAALWGQSGVCALLDRLDRAFPRWLAGSAVFRLFARDGAATRAWPGSITSAVMGGAANLPTALVRWIYRPCRKVLEGSFFWRLIALLGQSTALLTGLFLLVLLSVPHDYWNNAYGFLGALVLAGLFVLASARGQLQVELKRLGPWFALFLLSIGAALFTSYSTSLSLRFFLFYVGAFLLTLLIVSSISRPEQLLALLTAVAFGLLICGTYGCWQAYTGVEVVASQQDMLVNYGMPGRIYSFFDNPNNFAEILVMLLPLVFALLIVGKNWRVKVLSLAALAVGVVSLGATLSRSSWIGIAVAAVVFLALINWKVLPLFLLVGIFCLPLLPDTIYNRILTIGDSRDTSTNYRFQIYNASFTMMKDYWFRGTGLGSDAMVSVFELYPPMRDGNFPVHTHNNYLQMWGELGLFGGIFHLGTVFGQLKQGVKSYYTAPADRTVRVILAAAIGAFCGILVVGLAEYTWYYPRNLFIFWSLFGVIAACVKLSRKPEQLSAC